jgi:hypothetical protein
MTAQSYLFTFPFLLFPLRIADCVLPFNFKQGHGLLAVFDADGIAGRQWIARVRGGGGNFADQNLAGFRV